MDLNKEFVYNNDKIVLLICDYYETIQIPREMYDVKDNLALFPVVNVPLIEFILTSLAEQNFRNIIITGTKINSILKHLEETHFAESMKIRVLRSPGSSLGDVFREIDHLDLQFKDLIVMYANHYTNISLNKLLKKHKKSKNKLLTLFTYKNDTNDNHVHVYVTHENDIVYYSKISGKLLPSDDIMKVTNEYGSIVLDTSLSSPTIAAISNQVFPLFTEHFDFKTLGDLIEGILATKLYNNPFQIYKEEEICKDVLSTNKKNEMYAETFFYSREIVTLLDYFKFNQDLHENPQISSLPYNLSFIKSEINIKKQVKNSFIGEYCNIDANLYNCVIWDNVNVKEDYNEFIVFSSYEKVNVFHLEDNSQQNQDSQKSSNSNHSQTFFDDINDYLRSCITTARFYDLDMGNVSKQISLIRIAWNASRQEIIEAYAYFLVNSLDTHNLEDTMSKASVFFSNLAEFIHNREDEDLLLGCIYENLSDTTLDKKAQIFFNYVYLFVQDGMVTKSAVKKYNKMYKEGLL